MKVCFVSNYINHHQIPFCDALYAKLGADFSFIQTEPMEEERSRMGWAVDRSSCPYVRYLYEEENACRGLIEESDLLIAGWTRQPELLYGRLASGRPAFRISERIYREGQWKAISPRGLWAKWQEHGRFRRLPVYLLCAGAYVASDFALIGAYPDKMLRFGYFPQTRRYPGEGIGDPMLKKGDGPVRFLWVGRLMALKHPEYALWLARDMKRAGLSFTLDMVGGGELEEELKGQVVSSGLEDRVRMHGFLAPERVRDLMEESDVFLFTSNHLEGWGAVVNEAMNSGCAVVASESAGAVPTLIRDGINGKSYAGDSYEAFRDAALELAEDRTLRRRLGNEAYRTIVTQWNAENAAGRVLALYDGIINGKPVLPMEGPLSRAHILKPPK